MDGKAIHERIAAKAYELYQKRGQSHGRDLEDWFEAERAVLAESKPRPAERIAVSRKPARRKRKE